MINYQIIADAVKHYKKLGYEYIEVPWFVSLDTLLITRPPGVRIFSTFAGELVASGEQSFLEMRKELKPGKYQCVTPCFRDEKIIDKYHHQYFIKNELIFIPQRTEIPAWDFGKKIIDDAFDFFKNYGTPVIVDTPLDNSIINIDILINGVEVGSYGIRQFENFVWCYGTGVALPRLTEVINGH